MQKEPELRLQGLPQGPDTGIWLGDETGREEQEGNSEP